MGGDDDVIHAPKGAVFFEGFGLEDVEDGAGKAAGRKLFDKSAFIEHLPAGDIDDDGGFGQQRKAAAVYEPFGLAG